VKDSIPRLPRLLMVKVAPARSSGYGGSMVCVANVFILAARSASVSVWALWTTGPGDRGGVASEAQMNLAVVAFTAGVSRRAWMVQ